jgi:pimeloyl-ACP methyl ester carboxylesterase
MNAMPDTLILVPGLDGTGQLYYRQVPRLRSRYDVVVHPLRDDATRMDDLVGDLHQAVTRAAKRGGRVTVVGESFGGALALSYALTRPEALSQLVVLNSFAHYGQQRRLRLGRRALRVAPWGVMRVLRRFTTPRLLSPHVEPDERRRYRVLMRQTSRHGYLSRLGILCEYDVRDRLQEIDTPVLFLAADRDHLIPAVEQAQLMAARAPRASVRILEGHGHICLLAPDLDLLTILDEWGQVLSHTGSGPVTHATGHDARS